MIRILIYLLLLAAVAYGADWLLQRPGHIDVTWAGYHITTSAAVGFALIVLLAVVLMVVLVRAFNYAVVIAADCVVVRPCSVVELSAPI